jgi:hypothetical protein
MIFMSGLTADNGNINIMLEDFGGFDCHFEFD